ncbi:hypothetical protein D3C73_849430 [compost metagenome]
MNGGSGVKESKGIIIPTLAMLEEITKQHNYKINKELDPIEEFEVYNEETESGFTCMMTVEYELFSIDIDNPMTPGLVEILKEILNLYNLPTFKLIEDIRNSINIENNFITEYKYYWVEYKPNKEENILLLRYREFVEG